MDKYDTEYEEAVKMVNDLLEKFSDTFEGTKYPRILYVSDNCEIQSWVMYAGMAKGFVIKRTNKDISYLE